MSKKFYKGTGDAPEVIQAIHAANMQKHSVHAFLPAGAFWEFVTGYANGLAGDRRYRVFVDADTTSSGIVTYRGARYRYRIDYHSRDVEWDYA